MASENSTRPLYNSRIIDTYIKLVTSRYSFVNVIDLLNYADMKPYEVSDQGHWFTQDQVNRFYEKLVKVTNNSNIAREAGRYAASPDALGFMRIYLLGMVSPAKVYELANKTADILTRSSAYETKKITSNKVEINVTPLSGITEQSYQCENRIGLFEAVTNIYNFKTPHIDHPECVFRGGDSCRYIISWEISNSTIWKRIRDIISIITLSFAAILLFINPLFSYTTIASVFLLVIVLLAYLVENKLLSEIDSSLSSTRTSSEKLLEQININYNNTLLVNEVGQALSAQTKTKEILDSVSKIMENRLNYDRGLILLANQDRTKLEVRSGYGYEASQLWFVDKMTFHLDRPESRGVFVVCFREQKPFLINDFDELEGSLSPRSLSFAKKMGTQSFICCPIVCVDESIGVLAVDNVTSKRPLIQSDMSLLMGIASSIGISISNAEHIEANTRQFNSIMQVLAASIDARDTFTKGHSEKVTEYSLGICAELNLPENYSEMVRVAALLHDYGKIGVPDSILKKEGRLTPEEYDIIKTHSTKTQEILSQINFEGVYRKVPEVAGAHHEKLDGSGYPRGLLKNEIPLGSKIIAVADFFEAITSKRHYRDPLPVEEAMVLLKLEGESHFDKKLIDAFIAYYYKTYPERLEGQEIQLNLETRQANCDLTNHMFTPARKTALQTTHTKIHQRNVH